jgi:hypothetical protein
MKSYDQARQLVLVMLKGIPAPSPEQIRSTVKRVCEMLGAGGKLDFSEDKLFTEIETLVDVWIGTGTTLDDTKDHEAWLPDKRATINWHFWRRYERFLEEESGIAPIIVQRLGQLTDSVLERLEDPHRPSAWDRRGMVVGNVQSGKTANYIGLVTKAVDAGYKLIIILAGIHKSLRSQTQLRFDEGFLGFDTQRSRAYNTQNLRIGVGKLPTMEALIAHSLTSSADGGDFNRNIADQVGVRPGGNDPILLVVKKNKSILENLLTWVQAVSGDTDHQTGRRIVRNVPLLLIDDEADNASVNTNPIPVDDDGKPLDDYDVTAINGGIRKILDTFEKSAYVGYTATPFANIFIYPEGETLQHGEDLFPRSFIINLPTPTNYVGPARVFGIQAAPEAGIQQKIEGLPLIRDVKDNQPWMPDKHKKDLVPGEIPESLKKAIRCFILTCAARMARGQSDDHNSMLIHVTRFADVQKRVEEAVRKELVSLQGRLQYGDGNAQSQLATELEDLWNKDFVPTTTSVRENVEDPEITPLDWQDVKTHLIASALKIEIKIINGTAGDILDYRDHPHGLSAIAIGGEKLSRGLTLYGLSVSYFLRATKMYDTLMQMGRWFGYRPGYLDLCRLFTTPDLAKWYRHITLASEELRREFDHMAEIRGTPAEYGLRVRTHPDGLIITAVNKMRTGTVMRLSYSGTISESVAFDSTPAVIQSNFERFSSLIEDLSQNSQPTRERENFIWKNVEGSKIKALFSDLKTHPDSWKANSQLLAEYIQKKIQENELTSWTVALISKSGKGQTAIGGRMVEPTTRDLSAEPGKLSIGRLVNPIDETLDFDEAKRREALARTVSYWKSNPGRVKNEPDRPAGPVIREMRSPHNGLLLIYPIKPPAGDETPVMGFAISFPKSGTQTAIEYKVNNVYWDQEFGGQ